MWYSEQVTESTFRPNRSPGDTGAGGVVAWPAYILLAGTLSCANHGEPSGAHPAQSPIPRFPSGLTLESGRTGPALPGTSAAKSAGTTTSSSQVTLPKASSSGVSLSTVDATSASPTLSSAGTSSTETSVTSDEPLEPGRARYIDAAYVRVSRFDDGSLHESFKFESPHKEHEYVRVGNRRVTNMTGLGSGNIERRSYLIFDVSDFQNAVSARIELFVFASSEVTNNHGGYESPDPEETVAIRAVDNFSPQDIINSSFNQNSLHKFDVPLFEDLGDGALYGQRAFNAQTFAVEKLIPTRTASPRRSNCADMVQRACGRWVSFELTEQAIQAINETRGLWATGWSMSTISHHKSPANEDPSKMGVLDEWLFVGGFFDLHSSKGAYPDYIGPKPRLFIESGGPKGKR